MKTPAGGSDRVIVLLEELREKNNATIEAVTSLGQRMDRKFEEVERNANTRSESLEAAVRLNSKDIQELKTDVKELKSDMKDVKSQLAELTRRIDRIEEKLSLKADGTSFSALLRRVEQIEQKLGISAS